MNVSVKGPEILWDFYGIKITETIRNGWIIMLFITLLCIWLASGLKKQNPGKKQIVAEKIVGFFYGLTDDVMGKKYQSFAPYIGALFMFSLFGSLSSLLGARPMTGDLNTTLGWSLMTFVMVQVNNMRLNGFFGWLRSFASPVAFMLPLNIISEVANPVSMAFRHFGNIASGIVISALVYAALAAGSNALLANTFLGGVPILQIGIPAVLSIYFDLFTSFLQAYIICMLTMVFVSGVE